VAKGERGASTKGMRGESQTQTTWDSSAYSMSSEEAVSLSAADAKKMDTSKKETPSISAAGPASDHPSQIRAPETGTKEPHTTTKREETESSEGDYENDVSGENENDGEGELSSDEDDIFDGPMKEFVLQRGHFPPLSAESSGRMRLPAFPSPLEFKGSDKPPIGQVIQGSEATVGQTTCPVSGCEECLRNESRERKQSDESSRPIANSQFFGPGISPQPNLRPNWRSIGSSVPEMPVSNPQVQVPIHRSQAMSFERALPYVPNSVAIPTPIRQYPESSPLPQPSIWGPIPIENAATSMPSMPLPIPVAPPIPSQSLSPSQRTRHNRPLMVTSSWPNPLRLQIAGGIDLLVYVYADGRHELLACRSDQPVTAAWGADNLNDGPYTSVALLLYAATVPGAVTLAASVVQGSESLRITARNGSANCEWIIERLDAVSAIEARLLHMGSRSRERGVERSRDSRNHVEINAPITFNASATARVHETTTSPARSSSRGLDRSSSRVPVPIPSRPLSSLPISSDMDAKNSIPPSAPATFSGTISDLTRAFGGLLSSFAIGGESGDAEESQDEFEDEGQDALSISSEEERQEDDESVCSGSSSEAPEVRSVFHLPASLSSSPSASPQTRSIESPAANRGHSIDHESAQTSNASTRWSKCQMPACGRAGECTIRSQPSQQSEAKTERPLSETKTSPPIPPITRRANPNIRLMPRLSFRPTELRVVQRERLSKAEREEQAGTQRQSAALARTDPEVASFGQGRTPERKSTAPSTRVSTGRDSKTSSWSITDENDSDRSRPTSPANAAPQYRVPPSSPIVTEPSSHTRDKSVKRRRTHRI
jgi:hypothetical protein